MRRAILITVAAAALAATGLTAAGWAARGTAADPARLAPAAHQRLAQTSPSASDRLGRAAQLAAARLATATYATNLAAAKADGYQIITPMIPDMGWHYLNPSNEGLYITNT